MTHVNRERDGGSSSTIMWHGLMARHGPMDLPIANHLEAYFIRKEGEAGVEKFMREYRSPMRQHHLFDRKRLERTRLQIKRIIWALARRSQV